MILFPPPSRVWEPSLGGFTSRPWKRQELIEYIRSVLNREPTEADYQHCDIEKERK